MSSNFSDFNITVAEPITRIFGSISYALLSAIGIFLNTLLVIILLKVEFLEKK